MFSSAAQQEATSGGPPGSQRFAPGMPASYRAVLRRADRACCCPARPAVAAVIPPAPGRDHATDLLLCGHHYRASRRALAAAGAAVFDSDGRCVMPQAPALARCG